LTRRKLAHAHRSFIARAETNAIDVEMQLQRERFKRFLSLASRSLRSSQFGKNSFRCKLSFVAIARAASSRKPHVEFIPNVFSSSKFGRTNHSTESGNDAGSVRTGK
jgi:hypothetical protein